MSKIIERDTKIMVRVTMKVPKDWHTKTTVDFIREALSDTPVKEFNEEEKTVSLIAKEERIFYA